MSDQVLPYYHKKRSKKGRDAGRRRAKAVRVPGQDQPVYRAHLRGGPGVHSPRVAVAVQY